MKRVRASRSVTRVARVASWLALVVAGASSVAHADEPPSFSQGRGFDERSGEALYRSICQGCHQPRGEGAIGAGAYPALAGDANLASPQYPVVVLLAGRRNMPSFARSLDDAQIAAVASYVRSRFGGYGEPVTAADVAALRPPK